MGAGVGNGFRWGGPLQFDGYPSGAWVTNSGTIGPDSRVPFIPIREGRSQTEQAAPWSTPVPCFRSPYDTTNNCWFQPVAAVDEVRLRQLNSNRVRPDEAEDEVADRGKDSSRHYRILSGIPQTQDAASKANPEVQKCR
jgi:hypothetical protein